MRKLWMLMVLISLVLVSGCQKKETTTIRIAHFPNITHAQALLARADGIYEKELGDVECFVFNAGPSEIEAFFAGELDLGYIGPVPAINGHIKSSGDIVIIAGATNGGAMLLVSEQSTITSIHDLQHKKIAIPQIGNTQHLSLLNMLSENGLADTTKGGNVEVVAASNPDIKTLMLSGEIEAAYVPEPWASRLVYEANARILLDYDDVFFDGDYATALVITRKDFLNKYPEKVEAFLRIHLDMTEYIKNNLDESKQKINNEIEALTGQKLDSIVIDSVFTKLFVETNPNSESVMAFMDISYDEGFISKKASKDALFNFTILNKLHMERGLPRVE